MSQSAYGGNEGLTSVLGDAPRVLAELLGDPKIAGRIESRVEIDDEFACEVLREGLVKAITALRAMHLNPERLVRGRETEQESPQAQVYPLVGGMATIAAQLDDMPDAIDEDSTSVLSEHPDGLSSEQMFSSETSQADKLPRKPMRFLTDYFDGSELLDQLTVDHAGQLATVIAEQYVNSTRTKQSVQDIADKLRMYLVGATNQEIADACFGPNAPAVQTARSITFRTVKARIGAEGLSKVLRDIVEGNGEPAVEDTAAMNKDHDIDNGLVPQRKRVGRLATILAELDGMYDTNPKDPTLNSEEVAVESEITTNGQLPDRTIKYFTKYFGDSERVSLLTMDHTSVMARAIADQYVSIIRSRQQVEEIADKLERYMRGASDKEIGDLYDMTVGSVNVMRATVYKVVKARLGVEGLSELLDSIFDDNELVSDNIGIDKGSYSHEVDNNNNATATAVIATPKDVRDANPNTQGDNSKQQAEDLLRRVTLLRQAEGFDLKEVDDEIVFGVASLLGYPGITIETGAAKTWLRDMAEYYRLRPTAENKLDERHIRILRHVTLDFGNTSLATAEDAFRRHSKAGNSTVNADLLYVLNVLFEMKQSGAEPLPQKHIAKEIEQGSFGRRRDRRR